MSKIPEGTETAVGEGADLRTAIQSVAEALNVEEKMVHYTFDLSHFRSASGVSRAVRSVKIIGWAGDEPRADFAPRPAANADDSNASDSDDRDGSERRSKGRNDKRKNKRDDRNDRDDRRGRGLKGPEEGTTPASEFAQEWLEKLMEQMDIEGEVVATGSDERVHIQVSAKERAGRLIGRRGSTLASIRQILALALEKHGELTIDVDVEDNRSGDDDRRSERKERGGRDRGNRKQERGPRYSDEKLQALAKRAAEKAVETSRAVTINLDLNSYGRRIVHLTIADIEGVSTVSEEREGRKVVQVVPD